MKNILLISISFLIANLAWSDEPSKVIVYTAGWMNKPGTYKLEKKTTVKRIKEVCGGWNETWGATKRVVIISLARPANLTMNRPEPTKEQKRVFNFQQEDQTIVLEDGDIIFMPQKEWIGR